jgi:hypothetical protein
MNLKKAFVAGILAVGVVATCAFAYDPNANPEEWQKMLQKSLRLSTFTGEPWIMAINATGDELTVTCDGKWTIVGPNPYKSVSKNPASLAPYSITPIHTGDFEGYCKTLTGQGGFNSYEGKLNAGVGNFASSTLVMFSAK